jgi:hypothetical protein
MYSLLMTHQSRQCIQKPQKQSFEGENEQLRATSAAKIHSEAAMTTTIPWAHQEFISKTTASPMAVRRKATQCSFDCCCSTGSTDLIAPAIPEHDSHNSNHLLGACRRISFSSSDFIQSTFPTVIAFPFTALSSPSPSASPASVASMLHHGRQKLQKARYLPEPDDFPDKGGFFDDDDDGTSIETPIDDQYIPRVFAHRGMLDGLRRHFDNSLRGPPSSSSSTDSSSTQSWMYGVTPVMRLLSLRPPPRRHPISSLRCCIDDTGERPEKPFRSRPLCLAKGQDETRVI